MTAGAEAPALQDTSIQRTTHVLNRCDSLHDHRSRHPRMDRAVIRIRADTLEREIVVRAWREIP